MNEEYNNQNPSQNQPQTNPAGTTGAQEDTTYHRSYLNDSDPNAKTYINAGTQETSNGTANANNANAGNAAVPPVYATYTPGGQQTQQTNAGAGQTWNAQAYTNAAPNAKPAKPKKPRKHYQWPKFVGKAVAFGAIAGCIMIGMTAVYRHFDHSGGSATQATMTTAGTVKTTSSSSSSSGSVSDLVNNVMPSIVSITSTFQASSNSNFNDFYYWFYGGNNQNSKEQTGSGSGVIVSETDDQLLIVTNNHVVSDNSYGDAKKVQVTFSDDKTVEATVKGADSDADLAVLTVKKSDLEKSTLETVKVAVIGDSDSVNVGDDVIAIGNALGYGQSVTRGIVSAKNREVQLEDKTMTLLQTDAAINPGNSGGALLNTSGELIGINSVKYASDEVEGMGYAIPMAIAQPIIEELMNEEEVGSNEQAYLGIYGTDVGSELAQSYNMPEGVWVRNITDNSPAAEAGIQQRDIITKFNDHEISSMESLQNQIAKKKAGTEVTLTVKRQSNNGEYKEMKIKVTLGNKKDAKDTTENNPQSSDNAQSSNGNSDNGSSNGDNNDNNSGSTNPFEYFFGN